MKTNCPVPVPCGKTSFSRPVFALLPIAAALAHGADLPGARSGKDSPPPPTLGSAARSQASLTAVTHGNGIWVGVSADSIITSRDGLDWQAVSQVSRRKTQGVAFDGKQFVSYNPPDGTVVMDRERLGAAGQYVASPVGGGGLIYAASHAGRVAVIRVVERQALIERLRHALNTRDLGARLSLRNTGPERMKQEGVNA